MKIFFEGNSVLAQFAKACTERPEKTKNVFCKSILEV
jgi:hypothetical protein